MSAIPDDMRAIFEAQWPIYRKVIDHDYMEHAAIHRALSGHVANNPGFGSGLGDILDLGCGDAEISSALVEQFRCNSYLGVDSSAMALEQAATKPQWNATEPRFMEAELLGFVTEEQRRFDLILTGFVLHHLNSIAKREFFHHVKGLLRPGGTLLFYDVFCLPGLSRDASVEKYLRWIRQDWKEINDMEYQAIAAHIDSSDFPENLEWILSAAHAAGLKKTQRLVCCANGFHHALALCC